MAQPSEILDRAPPQDLAAEMRVLGSILHDQDVLDDIDLNVDEFHADCNKRIYRHLLAMRTERKPLEATLLSTRLRDSNELEVIGGNEYLSKVVTSVAYAVHAKYHAGIVREKARRRAMIHAATEMLREAWATGNEAEDVLEAAERALCAIRTNDSTRAIVTASDAALRAMDAIDASFRNERLPRLATGMVAFDETFGGLPSGLCILAARLGVGKTSLACQWADYAASKGRLTYFASLEMAAAELATRILCTLSGVDSKRIDTGKLTQSDIESLSATAGIFAGRAMRFDERPRLRVSDIRREARKMVKDGLKLIVVDYLQIVSPEDRRAPREQQVARVAEDLKALSRELSIPVLALAQINRQATDGKAPGPEHLRESDAIGQHADMVITISVDEEGQGGAYPAWIRVGKNRNGPKGKMRVNWIPVRTMFEEFHEQPHGDFADYQGDY